MRNAVVVEAVRTPIGKGKQGGMLTDEHPVALLAGTLRALVERTGIDPALVDDVIGGCVSQVGDQSLNLTRSAVLASGFPESVPATTVDRQCGSSQQAVHFAAQGVISGAYDIVIACGVESMSRVPMGSSVLPGSNPFAPLDERYPQGLVGQGISAELIAAKWKLDRSELDAFALQSHQRATAAWEAGEFDREVTVKGVRDETVRPGTSLEALAGLRAAYHTPEYEQRFPEIGWQVTAGNSSPINDGAAAVLIMGEEVAQRLGLRARARLTGFAVAGDDPQLMLTAVIPATSKVLERTGLSLSDIDLFEVNEAFASVVLAWQRETGADLAKTNVRGGAIALGHPLGGSGARILTTLLHALEDRDARFGLQTMCEAGGLANALVLENLRA
ncbi:thiolase family protein [Streptomyces sp. TRM66268-LWL]|uniref:Thiolase family protein n=1 Tax=Streptomyces polyasparticus TaxID=2767826 RepID=A0ABR7SQ85_9ACTN|nr:thiolase family protein [Streptomyces polyasparticus]MBC9716488.1 thiolase family protein [Streptomyces polyasparticus]